MKHYIALFRTLHQNPPLACPSSSSEFHKQCRPDRSRTLQVCIFQSSRANPNCAVGQAPHCEPLKKFSTRGGPTIFRQIVFWTVIVEPETHSGPAVTGSAAAGRSIRVWNPIHLLHVGTSRYRYVPTCNRPVL